MSRPTPTTHLPDCPCDCAHRRHQPYLELLARLTKSIAETARVAAELESEYDEPLMIQAQYDLTLIARADANLDVSGYKIRLLHLMGDCLAMLMVVEDVQP